MIELLIDWTDRRDSGNSHEGTRQTRGDTNETHGITSTSCLLACKTSNASNATQARGKEHTGVDSLKAHQSSDSVCSKECGSWQAVVVIVLEIRMEIESTEQGMNMDD